MTDANQGTGGGDGGESDGGDAKEKTLFVRVSAEEHEQIQSTAKRRGFRHVAEFVRQALREAIRGKP